MNLFEEILSDYKKNRVSILRNILSKTSKFQTVTKKDFYPYPITKSEEKEINDHIKSSFRDMGKFLSLMSVTFIPFAFLNVRYHYITKGRLKNLVKFTFGFSALTFGYLSYANTKMSKFFEKKILKLSIRSKTKEKEEEERKLIYKRIKFNNRLNLQV